MKHFGLTALGECGEGYASGLADDGCRYPLVRHYVTLRFLKSFCMCLLPSRTLGGCCEESIDCRSVQKVLA